MEIEVNFLLATDDDEDSFVPIEDIIEEIDKTYKLENLDDDASQEDVVNAITKSSETVAKNMNMNVYINKRIDFMFYPSDISLEDAMTLFDEYYLSEQE